MAKSAKPWIENEKRYANLGREGRRLWRRAMRRRPFTVFFLSIAMTGLLVAMQSRKKSFYDASVRFRMEENRRRHGEVAPPARRQLRQYIFDGIFTKPSVFALIEKHRLYPRFQTPLDFEVLDLQQTQISDTSVGLEWTAPGLSGKPGQIIAYDLRYDEIPITEQSFAGATRVTTKTPAEEARRETLTIDKLKPGTLYYLAVKAQDDKGNWTDISNIAPAITRGGHLPANFDRPPYVSRYTTKKDWAIVEFREFIDIKVTRNYFLLEAGDMEGPRTARIQITFTHSNSDMALKLVRELAALIEAREAEIRQRQAKRLTGQSTQAEDLARQDLARLEQKISSAQVQLATTAGVYREILRVEVKGLKTALEHQKAKLKQLSQETDSTTVVALREQARQGMRFTQVDWGQARELNEFERRLNLAILGSVVFVILIVAIGMILGALDPRIYDLEDLGRVGFFALGHIPPFEGDRFGAYEKRQDRMKGAT